MHLTDHTVTRLPNEELKAAPGQKPGAFLFFSSDDGETGSLETNRILQAYSCKSLVSSAALDVAVKCAYAHNIGTE
jgi:hypothetical protein